VPVDDIHTLHAWFTTYPRPPGSEVPEQDKIPFYKVPLPLDESGNEDWELLDNNNGQDIMAWITQGLIADRSLEKLGESDKGDAGSLAGGVGIGAGTQAGLLIASGAGAALNHSAHPFTRAGEDVLKTIV
jgi:hypothetical protein